MTNRRNTSLLANFTKEKVKAEDKDDVDNGIGNNISGIYLLQFTANYRKEKRT